MRLRFGPNDEDAFYAAKDELVLRFEQTPGGHDLSWVADQVLEFKWGYLDGDLARWAQEEVEEILLGLYPAKVMLDSEDLETVSKGFARFLRFLGHEGIVSDYQVAQAATWVERLTPRFRVAALDERNWSMGKRLWSQAQSEGVDPTDEESLQRFTEDFNRRSFAERDAVLGPLPAPTTAAIGAGLVEPLPPIVLPRLEELEAAAGDTIGYTRLRRLVDYVGEGRPLTDRGNLKLADGKTLVDLLETGERFDKQIGDKVYKTRSTTKLGGVDLTFRMAVESGMLRVQGKKVLSGPNAGWVDEPLSALYGAWLAILNVIGPTQYRYRDHVYGWDWYAEELDASLPMILVNLFRDGDTPIADIAEDSWDHLETIFDLDGVPSDKLAFHRDLVEHSLRRAFDILSVLGTVRVEGVTEIPTEIGTTHASGGTVGLTPLGKWAVQRFASRVTSAPVVGTLRELTAAELLAKKSDLPEEDAIAEIDVWIDHQGDDAALELVEALRTADETGRGLGFRALVRIGPEAADAVGRLADDPVLGPYVTVWRVDTRAVGPDDMDCEGDPERFVRLLGAVIELWGPTAAVTVWAEPAAGAEGLYSMLDRAWRLKRPETEQVLAAIGDGHPEKTIAKAARKALFKYRSAG